MSGKTVLLVDDDPGVRLSLTTTLRLVDIHAIEAASGEDCLRIVRENPPDLVVLDVRMPPGMDGFETFRELRSFSKTPVIFLSAHDSIENQMLGIEMGAWDYVSKEDFQPALLSRKIGNLLENSASTPGGTATDGDIEIGRLRYDAAGRHFVWDEQRIEPTNTETRILAALMRRPSKVFERDELQNVIGPDVYIEPKTIDSHIKGLRRRFRELEIPKGTIIRTRPGIGYQLGPCR